MSPVKTLELYKTPMRHLHPGKERVRGIFTKLTAAHGDRQELMGQEPIFCPESNRDKIGPECSWLVSGRWHIAQMLQVLNGRRDNSGSTLQTRKCWSKRLPRFLAYLLRRKLDKAKSVFFIVRVWVVGGTLINTFQAETEDENKNFILRYKCGSHWHEDDLKTWKQT